MVAPAARPASAGPVALVQVVKVAPPPVNVAVVGDATASEVVKARARAQAPALALRPPPPRPIRSNAPSPRGDLPQLQLPIHEHPQVVRPRDRPRARLRANIPRHDHLSACNVHSNDTNYSFRRRREDE